MDLPPSPRRPHLTALACAAVLLAATFAAMPAQSVPAPQVACTPIIFTNSKEVSVDDDPRVAALMLPAEVKEALRSLRLTALYLPDLSVEGKTPPVATGSTCGISGAVNGVCHATGCMVYAEDACISGEGNWDIAIDETVTGIVTGTMTCGSDSADDDGDGHPNSEVVWCSTTEVAGTTAGHCEELGVPGDGEGKCGADADALDGEVVVECADPYGQGKVISIVMHFA